MESFSAISGWKTELETKLLDIDTKKIPVILLANKIDVFTNIDEAIRIGAQLETLCQSLGITKWYTVSAKDNTNIDLAMEHLLHQLIEQYENSHPMVHSKDKTLLRFGNNNNAKRTNANQCCVIS